MAGEGRLPPIMIGDAVATALRQYQSERYSR